MRALPLLLLAACAPGDDELAAIEVQNAWVSDWDPEFVAFIGGFGGDAAALTIEDRSGNLWVTPVTLRGGMVGAAMEISVDIGPDDTDGFRLPDEPITADQLLGTYGGSGGSFVMAFGISGRELKNPHGVVFAEDHLSAGMSIMGALEWLVLKRRGDVELYALGSNEDTGE